ncbi:MAG: CTP-dependent riboflavin kinase [Candidatus Micrarchaeota archaeon]|nr:CTP-dependent riboflavin kinase [Candidatus Micrarchaeota archaeon]
MISDIIFYLLRKGCHKEPKRITTGEIAEHIGVSQQTASRKLISLEKGGQIERTGGKIYLTGKAISEVRKLVKEVLDSLEGTSMVFDGSVVKGLGEGAYYLCQDEYTSQFKKRLGFKPFCGTLNILINAEDIEKRIMLRQQKAIEIPGFKKGNRTFGKLAVYKCVIKGTPAALVFPERSQHGLQVLEIVSPLQLRKKFNFIDGANVQVEVV